jgi:hypothetical protein
VIDLFPWLIFFPSFCSWCYCSPHTETCVLSNHNVASSGGKVPDIRYSYFERKSTQIDCSRLHTCANGKCINSTQVWRHSTSQLFCRKIIVYPGLYLSNSLRTVPGQRS